MPILSWERLNPDYKNVQNTRLEGLHDDLTFRQTHILPPTTTHLAHQMKVEMLSILHLRFTTLLKPPSCLVVQWLL